MNSVVLMSFFLCLQFTPGNEPMEARRYCSSFLLFYLCVCVCVAGLFTISKGVFSSILRNMNWGGGGGNKKGRNFSILKTRGDPTIRELLWGWWDGWYQSHQIWVLQSPRVSRLGKSRFGKLGVHQIRRRLVQFLSRFPPLLFERLKKRVLCFLFKESYTEIHLCGIHRLHLCHSWAAVGYIGQWWW